MTPPGLQMRALPRPEACPRRGKLPHSRFVYSVAANHSPGNIGILDPEALTWSWSDLRPPRRRRQDAGRLQCGFANYRFIDAFALVARSRARGASGWVTPLTRRRCCVPRPVPRCRLFPSPTALGLRGQYVGFLLLLRATSYLGGRQIGSFLLIARARRGLTRRPEVALPRRRPRSSRSGPRGAAKRAMFHK